MTALRSLVNAAFELARCGEYEDALEQFQMVLSEEPSNEAALYGAAACAYRLGKHSLADSFITRLIRIEPENEKALELRAKIDSALLGPHAENRPAGPPEELKEDLLRQRLEGPSPVREEDLVPEWQPLDVRVPDALDLIRDGKIERAGSIRIFRGIGDSWRTYRRHFRDLVVTGWVSTLIFLGLVSFFLTVMAGLGSVIRFLIYPTGFVGAFFTYPFFGVHTHFCFRLKKEKKVPENWLQSYFEKYPYLIFSQQWLFLPVFLFLLWGLLGYLSEGFSILNFYRFRNPWDGVTLFLIIGQIFLWFRCWFVNLVVFEREIPPLTAVSMAYFLTVRQNTRLLLVVVTQMILFFFSVLTLGLLLPLLPLFQVEIFEQLREGDAGTDSVDHL